MNDLIEKLILAIATKKNKWLILLDNGHGIDTLGKCSVDKRLREYAYTREIVKRLSLALTNLGIKYKLVTPEEKDISLSTRVKRINKYYSDAKKQGLKCLMISVHNNAAGNGKQWSTATGWEVWTTVGQNNSDILATCLVEAAEQYCRPLGIPVRKDIKDGDPDKEKNWYIIKNSNCISVLTENFFMDNKRECEWLLSEEGKNTVVNIHLLGIIKFINNFT